MSSERRHEVRNVNTIKYLQEAINVKRATKFDSRKCIINVSEYGANITSALAKFSIEFEQLIIASVCAPLGIEMCKSHEKYV